MQTHESYAAPGEGEPGFKPDLVLARNCASTAQYSQKVSFKHLDVLSPPITNLSLEHIFLISEIESRSLFEMRETG